MSDPPQKRKKLFFPDGRKIVHPNTILRRRSSLQSALDSELLSLFGNVSNDEMDSEMLESLDTDADTQMNVVLEAMDVVEYSNDPYSQSNAMEENKLPSSLAINSSEISNISRNASKCQFSKSKKPRKTIFLQGLPNFGSMESPDSSDTDVDETKSDTYDKENPAQSSRAVSEMNAKKVLCVPKAEPPTEPSRSFAEESTSSPAHIGGTSQQSTVNVPDMEDYVDFNIKQLKDYILTDGDKVMFAESGLRVWEVIIVILGISTRFNLTYKGRSALIEATKLFAGPLFAAWDISDYYLSKIFDPPNNVITYHFYCEICCKELEKPTLKIKFKKHSIACQKCLQKYTLSMNSPNYFISIDLRYQIASLLKMTCVKEGLFNNLKNVSSEARTDGIIQDVYDGILYKNTVSKKKENCIIITVTFATDGAPVNNSSKKGFWPKLLVLNELPPKLRFRYPLLAGLWIGKKEPSPDLMNMYMRSFVQQVNDLGNGFTLDINGKRVRFVLRPFVCSVDAVARRIVQNRLQFNGRYGCSWCLACGEHKNGYIRFLMEETEPSDRCHEQHLRDMKAIVKETELYLKAKEEREVTVVNVNEEQGHEQKEEDDKNGQPKEEHEQSETAEAEDEVTEEAQGKKESTETASKKKKRKEKKKGRLN